MDAEAPTWFGLWQATSDERVRTRWLYIGLATFLILPFLVGAGVSQAMPWVVVAAFAALGLTALACVTDLYARGWRGVWADHTGLTLVGWFGRRLQVPWADVALAPGSSPLAVVAGGETVTRGPRTAPWLLLLATIEQHLRRADDSGSAIAPAEVAQYLGIGPDGVLECRPPWNARPALGFVVLFFALAGLGSVRESWYSWPLLIIAFGSLAMALVFSGIPGPVAVRADAHGLAISASHGWRYEPWLAVLHMDALTTRRRTNRMLVTTHGGRFEFVTGGPGGTQLADGIRRILAARDAGHSLPSDQPASDAAISLARLTGTADAERGLSLSDSHDAD